MTTAPTLEQLIKSRHAAAVLVSRFGERFMPIFDRLDAEVKEWSEKMAAIESVLKSEPNS